MAEKYQKALLATEALTYQKCEIWLSSADIGLKAHENITVYA